MLPKLFKTLSATYSCHAPFPLQVFQTFSCEEFPELQTKYLKADLSIECYTETHDAYMIYAAIMIFLCEFTVWCVT